MDSEEEMNYDESEEDMSEDDDDHLNMVMEPEVSSTTFDTQDDTYPHEVLTPEQIVKHMVDCIKEVNTIVEVKKATTTTKNNRNDKR